MVALALISLAGRARAHDEDHHRLPGLLFKLSSPTGLPASNRLTFKSELLLGIPGMNRVDPRVQASSLLLRTSGAAPDSTGLVRLDPTRWHSLGLRGWRYSGDTDAPSSAGIRQITLRDTSLGGRLRIKAWGERWPIPPSGPLDSVEVFLSLGEHVYCAEFSETTGASFLKNAPGRVLASDATPPAECAAVCGNGILEQGEACDDGNDVDEDTCSNGCQPCTPQAGGIEATFEAIQAVVFDSPVYGCTAAICHGQVAAGGLDLRSNASYVQWVFADSCG